MTDIVFDTTWCPVCSRQILPKRYQVPLAPPPTTPAPPPSPAQTKSDAPSARMQRSKTGTVRQRQGGGLVHGTGRVKPNGALKRSDPTKEQQVALLSDKKTPLPPPDATRPAAPRTRTIIDPTPVPLYCSDECRLADLQSSFGSMSIDYHPDRYRSPPLPPVPHNSFDDVVSQSDSASSNGSTSVSASDSLGAFTALPPAPYSPHLPPAGSNAKQNQAEAGRLASARGYAALQSLYGLPPPPPPLTRTDTMSSTSSDDIPNDYQSGVMMAAKRIGDALCRRPEPKKRPSWATPQSALSTAYAMGAQSERPVIPGWTDGSNAWRASVYSFAAPPKDGKLNPHMSEDHPSLRAYRGHVATPLRSHGVYSTVTDSSIGSSVPGASSHHHQPPSRSQSEVDELYSKFSASLSRRSESRQSLTGRGTTTMLSTSPTGSTRSLPSTIGSKPLVAPGAEGKLLVPNVKMRRISSSGSEAGSGSFSRKRSPLSRQGSEMSVIDDDEDPDILAMSSSKAKKAASEARSWSYSDVRTYPIMQLPPKMERRVERRIVDGVERQVEVEVEVVPDRKRLFLFADEPSPRRRA